MPRPRSSELQYVTLSKGPIQDIRSDGTAIELFVAGIDGWMRCLTDVLFGCKVYAG